jgi:N-acetylglucosamine-6-phosphate deacetylase
MLKIKNGRLILDNVEKKNVYIENGKIVAITENDLPFDEEIDARGNYVSAGFIDTHVHGGGDYDFSDGGIDAFEIASKTHLLHGTTSLCPTLAALPHDTIKNLISDYKEFVSREHKALPRFLGLHLEGPYLNYAQAGGQPKDNIQIPIKEKYEELISLGEGYITKVTLAPELEGALLLCATLKEKGIIANIGHTEATYDEVVAAVEAGASCFTHLYSSMSTIVRKNSYRILGTVEAAYMLDDTYVEVIGDGIHLPPPLLKMITRFIDKDRIILITDAMRGADMPEGPSVLGARFQGMPCIIEDGIAKIPDRTSFAGSVATSDRLLRTMIKKVGLPIEQAVRYLTVNPARHLGLSSVGALKEGYLSDIVIFDDDVNVKTVIVGDEIIKNELA